MVDVRCSAYRLFRTTFDRLSELVASFAGAGAGAAAGWTAKLAPRVLPGRRLITREVVAIRHPRPVFQDHLLLLPRNRTVGLNGFLAATASAISAMLNVLDPLVAANFSHPEEVIAVINGGARQDVRLLHMHLLADAGLAAALHAAESGRTLGSSRRMTTSCPIQPVHVLYDRGVSELIAIMADLQRAVVESRLTPCGYSLMARAAHPMLLHLVGSVDRELSHVPVSV